MRQALTEVFQDCGAIASVRLPTDRETQELKGIAFIQFEAPEGKVNLQASTCLVASPSYIQPLAPKQGLPPSMKDRSPTDKLSSQRSGPFCPGLPEGRRLGYAYKADEALFTVHAATSDLDVTEAAGLHPFYDWIMLLECPQGSFVVQAAAAVLDGIEAADGSLKEDLSPILCTPIGDSSTLMAGEKSINPWNAAS